MPTITFSLKDLQHLVGRKITVGEIQELAHYGKGDFEGYDEETDEVKIDFGDTNLPYLWSVEGFARLIKGILGMQKGIPQIKINKGDYKIDVDKSVIKCRPYISCFAAKGRKIDDYLIKQMVQLQEKFCESYGRRRQKVSIGLYSYRRLKFPVHYKAVGPLAVEFVPLEFKAKMNLKEILAEHPKGKDYAWILEGFEKYPVLIDDNNEVMSFVPIINSNFTGKLEIGDEDMLFEATGTDEEAVNLAANIFAYALHERDFDIYSVEIKYPDKKTVSPDLTHEIIDIKNEQISRLFGLELKESEVKNLLEKAQFEFTKNRVKIPPYRKDIIHPYDVIEDIGIMYGFENIEGYPLATFTHGSTEKIHDFVDKIREIAVGLGYQEVMSPILANKDLLYKNMNIEGIGTIEIDDCMSETYSAVRSWLLPNLMEVFSKNKHVEFPQGIFEEGLVNHTKGDEIVENHKIAIAGSHDGANYTEMRQVLEYILKCFGLHCDIEEAEHGSFIEGRCARAIVKGKKVAYLGEINPIVLSNWGLEMPVAALELNLTELFEVMEKNKKTGEFEELQ
ncbi:phenylalanine--tRNA ligase subunit beta [Candidatus Woesearchaeota archaeon]|nr:phenylalanine--tRNA ligase subunit beta [Candidatus Woesearchaeota archaeon]